MKPQSILDIEAKYPNNFDLRFWSDCPEDWEKVVSKCLLDLIAADPEIMIEQYKEKFHGLRVYYLPKTKTYEELEVIVRAAEEEVYQIELSKRNKK